MYLILYVVGGLLTYFFGLLIQGREWCNVDDETPMLRAFASILWPGYLFGFLPVMFVARRLRRLARKIRMARGLPW